MNDSRESFGTVPNPVEIGDELTIIVNEGPDGEPIVDTLLRDRTGVRDAVRNSGKPEI